MGLNACPLCMTSTVPIEKSHLWTLQDMLMLYLFLFHAELAWHVSAGGTVLWSLRRGLQRAYA